MVKEPLAKDTETDQWKWRFANALPEPDFRYFSNAVAVFLCWKAKYTSIYQGINFAVCGESPRLWSRRRCLRSFDDPTYCSLGWGFDLRR